MPSWARTSVLSPKYEVFCCDQNGPPARREEGAYLNRYVTDEQRSRRPIFIATLWAGASWLFFRVARSTRMTQIWALRSRLEKQPTDRRRNSRDLGDGTLGAFRESLARGDFRRPLPALQGVSAGLDQEVEQVLAIGAGLRAQGRMKRREGCWNSINSLITSLDRRKDRDLAPDLPNLL